MPYSIQRHSRLRKTNTLTHKKRRKRNNNNNLLAAVPSIIGWLGAMEGITTISSGIIIPHDIAEGVPRGFGGWVLVALPLNIF